MPKSSLAIITSEEIVLISGTFFFSSRGHIAILRVSEENHSADNIWDDSPLRIDYFSCLFFFCSQLCQFLMTNDF